MTQLYRRYRQVNILKQGNREPQVRGFEEVSVNGHHQVRYFGDSDWSAAAEKHDQLPEGWMGFNHEHLADDLFSWPFSAPFSRNLFSPSEFTPSEVVVEARSQPNATQPNPLQVTQQNVSRSLHKVKRVFKNFPQALKAAWRELNQ